MKVLLLLIITMFCTTANAAQVYEVFSNHDYKYRIVCNIFDMACYTTRSGISSNTVLTPILDKNGPITCTEYFEKIDKLRSPNIIRTLE